MHDVANLIRRIVSEEINQVKIKLARVDSVEDNRTCSVTIIEDDSQLSEVRIQAAIGSTAGLYIKPEVNSYVLVVMDLIPFVVVTGDAESIELNGSSFGGLIKIEELVTQLEKTNELLDGIIGIINGAPIAETGSGAPSNLQIALKAAITGKSLGQYNNIENDRIVHG